MPQFLQGIVMEDPGDVPMLAPKGSATASVAARPRSKVVNCIFDSSRSSSSSSVSWNDKKIQ